MTTETQTRYAVVEGPLDTIRRYLPDNYTAEQGSLGQVIISGEDVAGWTLDGYVIPRLASGLYFAREISAEDAAKRMDPVSRNQSKTVGEDGKLRYSADGSEVFPGPTGVRRSRS